MASKRQRYVLVYQCGIANVFKVSRFRCNPAERTESRVLQHAFSVCHWFALGLAEAGAKVRTVHCDVAGDCARMQWQPGKGSLWADKKTAVVNA
jgi:hypothetical protein